MEAKLVDSLPESGGWQFEPKWDGFRCLAFRAGDAVELKAKSGKPLARYFPEVAARLQLTLRLGRDAALGADHQRLIDGRRVRAGEAEPARHLQ